MKNFGDTIRELRTAQDLGLRETAGKIGISPAYLSRIERNKERPPKPEIIKALAKELAADPDILFRLSSSTDPELACYLNENPAITELLRFIKESAMDEKQLSDLLESAKKIHMSSM